ncbi:hypothetical protein D3C86_1875740 [compost metagenome]
MTATKPLRVTDTKNPGGTGLEVQLAGEFLGLFPFVYVRQDFPLNETPHRIAHQLLGVVEVFLESGHGMAPERVSRTSP